MNGTDEDKQIAAALDPLLADAVPAVELGVDERATMRGRLLGRIAQPEPHGTRTIRADDGEWLPFLPAVERKLLLADDGSGMETALYRLAAGGTLPAHEHTHLEECWVLEGDVRVGDYPVFAGDMHIAYPGYAHDEIVAPAGALLLIKSQAYPPPAEQPGTPA